MAVLVQELVAPDVAGVLFTANPLDGAELEAAVKASPNYTAAYPSLAEAYLALGEKEKARGALRAALEVGEPEDPGEHDENLADARRLLAELDR